MLFLDRYVFSHAPPFVPVWREGLGHRTLRVGRNGESLLLIWFGVAIIVLGLVLNIIDYASFYIITPVLLTCGFALLLVVLQVAPRVSIDVSRTDAAKECDLVRWYIVTTSRDRVDRNSWRAVAMQCHYRRGFVTPWRGYALLLDAGTTVYVIATSERKEVIESVASEVGCSPRIEPVAVVVSIG